jgi:predicted TIM-barrel fold metal-dependent hydrolase
MGQRTLPRTARRLLLGLSFLLVAGCGPLPLQRADTLEAALRERIVPRLDAHQHMMSPAAQALIVPHPVLPEVALPAELDRLLRERERVSGSPPVGALFADDAIIREWAEGRWWQGRARIDRFMNNLEKQVRYLPKAYAADGASGFIAGNIRLDGAGATGSEAYNFLLGIRKGSDGAWQIASEMMSAVNPPVYDRPIDADRIVELLDDAGIRHAAVLSVGYWFGSPLRDPPVPDEAAKTRQENDWTVAQVARHPDRLVAFCSVNPLRSYALAELERCATLPRVRGMKIHLANSRVDLRDPQHVEQLRRFFRAANQHRLALVVHAKTQGGYGAAQGRVLLEQVLGEAPDVPVQIAHMANSWEVAKLFADAIAAGDPRTRRLLFDLAQAVPLAAEDQTPALMADIAATLRRIGLDRILFGSDMDVGGNPAPREHWKAIRKVPLSDAELRTIADNLPPYLR